MDALTKVFEEGEKLLQKDQKLDHLALIFEIVKTIIFWGDNELIEEMLSDSRYLLTFGALECTQYNLKF